ncbi:MAG: class I SAM-dependent methyltransferase [Acidimicrobiales bacterium]
MTFQLLDALDVGSTASFVDVGGGESDLVDQLLSRNFNDVTVLDVSKEAIAIARQRVGSDARVTWLVSDLLTWEVERRYDVWHDRAVFHFLAESEIGAYRSLLDRALAPRGVVILATFALDGPEFCSGLPILRYGPDDLMGVLGVDFELVTSCKEAHTAPGGVEQSFTWIAARRKDLGASPHVAS